MKKKRIDMEWTLREFARANELDAGNLSRTERSRVLPTAPTAKRLLRVYAFQPLTKPWKRAIDAYCREVAAEARDELEKP